MVNKNLNKKKIEIFCTLGPSSLNSKFLKNISRKKNVSLIRLNMSHVKLKNLKKLINFIKEFSSTPICIDTEGAQIRTKVKKKIFYKLGKTIKINKFEGNFTIYPDNVFKKIKIGDILDIGFDDLKAKVYKINQFNILLKTISSGKLENNKGINISNRSITLNYLTKKDIEAIKIAKEFNIKNYALSFTNSIKDIKRFNKLLPNTNNIFKLESKKAIKNLKTIIPAANNFLIDRGDLSKEIKIENVPIIQKIIFKIVKKFKNKKNIYIATNLLESMLVNKYPSRAEANDIFSNLESGAKGLVLAAETAIGKYPEASVNFIIKMINSFNRQAKFKL
jgi:pyruvate kinase